MIPQPINRTSRRAWPRIRLLRTGRWGLAAVACFLTTAELASAQSSVFRTRRSASSVALPLVVGGGFEFETDSDQTQYDLPFFAQYSFTETFQLSVETALSHIDAKSQAASTLTGIDDLEATLEYELIRERRFAPSFTVLGGARWPTSTDPDLGSSGTDLAIGLIATKEINNFEFDFNAIYTSSGDSGQQDILELPFALEYTLTHKLSLAAEIAPTLDMGGGGESQSETELTLGGIWHSSEFWTFESGLVLRDDSTWQLVFGWEYSFAGD